MNINFMSVSYEEVIGVICGTGMINSLVNSSLHSISNLKLHVEP